MCPFFFRSPILDIEDALSSNMVAEFGGLEVQIQFKRIKHVYLRVGIEGKIFISAPLKYCAKAESTVWPGLTSSGRRVLSEFINSKKDWICRRQENMKRVSSQVKPVYLDNTHLPLWGEKTFLSVVPASRAQCKLDESHLWVHTPDISPKAVRKIVEKWQRQELSQAIHFFSRKWEKTMGLRAREYRIRKMKTRWGTCNPLAKRIWISMALVEKPKICLEYILVHELVHFLERRHNHRFRALMSRFLPEWKEHQKLLNQVNVNGE